MYLQGFWPKSVYLKCFGNQLKTVYLQGPHSLRPCISRPCCTTKNIYQNFDDIIYSIYSFYIHVCKCERLLFCHHRTKFCQGTTLCIASSVFGAKRSAKFACAVSQPFRQQQRKANALIETMKWRPFFKLCCLISQGLVEHCCSW